jgi:hypothetical protein
LCSAVGAGPIVYVSQKPPRHLRIIFRVYRGMFVLLDCDRYAPVGPNIDARDCATAVDDALDGALERQPMLLLKLMTSHQLRRVPTQSVILH